MPALYIADLASLPWPHGLFRCAHKRLFDSAIPEAAKPRPEDCQPHVEAVARGLPGIEIRRCPYHRPDWKLAAEVAISCWQESGCDDQFDPGEAFSRANLSEETRWAAESFFIKPIWIDGPLLGNGQHRVCGMKLAEVTQCLVER